MANCFIRVVQTGGSTQQVLKEGLACEHIPGRGETIVLELPPPHVTLRAPIRHHYVVDRVLHRFWDGENAGQEVTIYVVEV